MYYRNDIYYFLCPLSGTVDPGDEPLITVLDASTGTAVRDATATLLQAQVMTLVAGSNKVYVFPWRIASNQASGSYLALVTYTVGGVYHHDEFLDKMQLGDSRVTGVVALDATVSKDATVAKDLTVAKAADISRLNPDNSAVVLAIRAKTDRLPVTPVGMEHLCNTLEVTPQAGSLAQMLMDCADAQTGSWIMDKTVSPNVLVIRRPDGSQLASFRMSNSNTEESRQRI